MTYIKKYFLPWLLICLVIFCLPMLISSQTSNDDAFYVVPIGVLIAALICSALYYFWDTKWGPEQRKKKMNRGPFTDFYKLGFNKIDDFAIGIIQNYQVIIRYNWTGSTGKPSISFETLFNPKKSGGFVHQKEVDELNKAYKKDKITWARNFLTKEWEFNFRPPSFENIIPYVERSVELLKTEKFESLTLQQADEMIPEFERYLEDERNQKKL